MTTDQRDITKPPVEGARWIDEELRAAIRELRMALLGKATDTVPAASKAWTDAATMVGEIMQQHGIPFDPQPDQVDITPALIERLLDEAELSPGEVTPGARAMLTILRWLYARAPEVEPQLPFDNWVARAVTLYDLRVAEATPPGPPPPPDRPLPASRAATPPAQV